MADFSGFNEQIVQGRTKLLRFRVKDLLTGNEDITAYGNFRFTCKRSAADPDAAAIFTKTLGSGIEKLDAANGLVGVTIGTADTDDLTDGKDVQTVGELQTRDGDMNDWSLIRGKLEILAQVSRANP
jgi:hypothetical protein